MNHLFRAVVIGLSLLSLSFVFVSPVAAKTRVAVMDFDNKTPHGGWRIGRGASDMLATELVKLKKYSVIERDKLASILKEQDLGASGRIDPATAVKIGKVLGVDFIVTGSVTEYGQSSGGGGGGGVRVGKKGYHAGVDVRVVNATTGEIVFADSAEDSDTSMSVRVFGIGGGESFNEKKATKVLRQAIEKVVAKISFEGGGGGSAAAAKPVDVLIADVDGSTVTLNQGSAAGFKVGQKVKISRKDKEIKDPATGKVIKVKYKKIGTIEITTVESSYAEGKIVKGEGFAVGDLAKQ
ncbi:MAG: CsgG/HfaB family protein [Gammaproteobacteria bacterium]|jgi:curli biogenesis system outer membrane secretion channel CsgG|nr:CsgG/HfaB family protein [Gammaproteobacteria bacterium]